MDEPKTKGCESYGNRSHYIDWKHITPIPFLVAQPEGMPRYIREMDDIIKLNEEEVKIFLRGYTESTEGKINELKRRLALSVDFPKDAVEDVFPLEMKRQYMIFLLLVTFPLLIMNPKFWLGCLKYWIITSHLEEEISCITKFY